MTSVPLSSQKNKQRTDRGKGLARTKLPTFFTPLATRAHKALSAIGLVFTNVLAQDTSCSHGRAG